MTSLLHGTVWGTFSDSCGPGEAATSSHLTRAYGSLSCAKASPQPQEH